MNYRLIIYTLGWVLSFEAVCMILPMVCGFIYGEKEALIFASCILICLIIGRLFISFSPKNKVMYSKEGFVSVALSWLFISIFGALPFIFSGAIPNIFDAFFETVSGFTTTGASVLSNVEILPKSIIFWRSFSHWIGGMGVIVLLVAVLPLSGGGNFHMIKAESTGPSVSKLVPKVKQTALILYGIYVVMTITQIVILLFCNMNLFEALTTTFGTAGTGGFGIRNDSFTGFSDSAQITVTIFMILFGIDFSVYYFIFVKRMFKTGVTSEAKTYLGIIIATIALISYNCRGMYESIWENLKHTAFQVGSIITTTGYTTADYNLWPEFSKAILVLLMIIGACAGSTGGGIKVSRIMILLKSIVKEIKIAAHPKSVHKLTMNGRTLQHETVRAVNVYMMAYLIIFAFSVIIISRDGYDFNTNFTGVLATLNNIGPGLGTVGPTGNFGMYSNLSKFVLSMGMLAGRLELFPLLVLFSPYTWKK